MPTIRAKASGFNGEENCGPGDAVKTSVDHARTAVLRGCADLLDDKGGKVPFVTAIKTLPIPDDEVRRVAAKDVLALAFKDAGAGTMVNRKVEALGTKTATQT